MNKKNNIEEYNNILKKLNILYIEDEENIRINVKKTLLLICNNVFDVDSIESSKEIISEKRIDIIISDINLPKSSGIEFAKYVRTIDKNIPIILLSAYTEKNILLEATKLKLIDYLIKPIDYKTLYTSLLKCVEEIIQNSRYIINFSNKIYYNVLYKKLYNNEINKEISLTSKEIDLLDCFIKNTHRLLSNEELKSTLSKDDIESTDSALKNILNKLRKKIGKETIINISGIGYRLNIK